MTKYVKLDELKALMRLVELGEIGFIEGEAPERNMEEVDNYYLKHSTNEPTIRLVSLKVVNIPDINIPDVSAVTPAPKSRKSRMDHLEDRVKELESDQAILYKLLGIVRDNEPGKNSMRIAANSLLFKQKEDANITKLTWEEVDNHSIGFNHKVGDTFKFFGTDHRVYGVNAEGITLEQIGESTGGFISFKKDQGRNDYRSKMK